VVSIAKTKVTLSLDPVLVAAVDERVRQSRHLSRSGVIEGLLRQWYEAEKQRELERQTEAYYLSLTEEEREEDRIWAEFASSQAGALWEGET
jgi:metal-responsive CopG/Arc/MetJ family transcriptional regulator